MTTPRRPSRPSAGWVGAVTVAHVVLLGARDLAPTPQAPVAPAAWQARWVEADPPPVPLAPRSPLAPPPLAPRPLAPLPLASPALPSRDATPASTRPAVRAVAPPAGPSSVTEPARGDPVHVPAGRHLRFAQTGWWAGRAVDGEAELAWRLDGDRYEAQWSHPAPAGRRTLRSDGHVGLGGLAPQRFGDRHRGESAAHFDAKAGRIRFSGHQPDAGWQPGTQDRVSVLLQLAGLAAASPGRFTPGQQVTLRVAGAREAADWTFRVLPPEELPPQGHYPSTMRLRREAPGPQDLQVDVWLAPDLGYIPVRIRLTWGAGDWLEQQWVPPDAR